MSDPFRHVRAGEPLAFSAGWYNAAADAGRYVAARQHDTRSRGLRDALADGQIVVKNDSGADVDQLHVLGLDVPLLNPTESENDFRSFVAFSGVEPTDGHWGKFAVLAEPLGDGLIGRAWVSGVCPVKLTVVDEDDQFADVRDGESQLHSASSGAAQILWKQGGTGADKWAVVRLTNDVRIVRKAKLVDHNLEEGDDNGVSAKLAEWNDDEDEWEAGDEEITVYPDAGFTGCAFRGGLVDVYRDGESGRWYALTGGQFFCVANADADIDQGTGGGGTATVSSSGGDPPMITINTAFTDIASGALIACWWDSAGGGHWDAAQIAGAGCGMKIDEDGNLAVDLAAIAGENLSVEPGEGGDCPKLKADVSVAYSGLCGIDIDNELKTIGLNLADLVSPGNGLKLIEGECYGLEMSVSCGLVDDGEGNLAVDLGTLVNQGNGLKIAAGSCDALEMSVSCGLIDDGAGNLQLDVSTTAGEGLIAGEGGGCGNLNVDCGYVAQCVEDALEDPDSSLSATLLDFIIENVGGLCDECENRLTCEDCSGEPTYRRAGGEWQLKDRCECDDVPTPPETTPEDGAWACGTCEPCACTEESIAPTIAGVENGASCSECAGFNVAVTLPRIEECLFRSEEFALCEETWRWTAEPDGDEGAYALYLERLDGDEWVIEATFSGEGCQGDFTLVESSEFLDSLCDFDLADAQTDPLTCEECDDKPRYVSDAEGEWTLEDLCECEPEDAVEPAAPGEFAGDRECGTCDDEPAVACRIVRPDYWAGAGWYDTVPTSQPYGSVVREATPDDGNYIYTTGDNPISGGTAFLEFVDASGLPDYDYLSCVKLRYRARRVSGDRKLNVGIHGPSGQLYTWYDVPLTTSFQTYEIDMTGVSGTIVSDIVTYFGSGIAKVGFEVDGDDDPGDQIQLSWVEMQLPPLAPGP